MKKLITIVALCLGLFASCTKDPLPSFESEIETTTVCIYTLKDGKFVYVGTRTEPSTFWSDRVATVKSTDDGNYYGLLNADNRWSPTMSLFPKSRYDLNLGITSANNMEEVTLYFSGNPNSITFDVENGINTGWVENHFDTEGYCSIFYGGSGQCFYNLLYSQSIL